MAESNVILVGELSLPAEPVRVGQARRHVAAVIRDWKVSVDVDTAVLLTSEIFTNAILHGGAADGEIRLVEAWDGERFRIEVHDSRPAGPDLGDRPLDAVTGESGRGLGMVELLADHWGVERTAEGKQVYFVLEGIGSLATVGSAESIGAARNAGTIGAIATAGANAVSAIAHTGSAAHCCLLGPFSALASITTPGDACSETPRRPVRKSC